MDTNNKEVCFTMRIETHIDERELTSYEDLIHAINRINNKNKEFVVVTSTPSVNSVTYIQTTCITAADLITITDEFYHVEAQTEEENGTLVNHVLETKDFENVVNIFTKYFVEHETPDFTSWCSSILYENK